MKTTKHPASKKKLNVYMAKVLTTWMLMALGTLMVIPFIFKDGVNELTNEYGFVTGYAFDFYGIPVANDQMYYGIAVLGVFLFTIGLLILVKTEK